MHPRFRLGPLAAALLALASTCVVAQTAPAAAPSVRPEQDPAERLLKEQREREREQRLNQRTPKIEAPKPDPLAIVPLSADPESIAETGATFTIDRVELVGNTVLSSSEAKRITTPFVGRQLGANRINLLMRRLTEAFIAKGYITTRAYLGEQNLASGILSVTVVPGKIENFRVNGQMAGSVVPVQVERGGPYNGGWLTDWGTLAAFPVEAGDTLKLQDLEQGVDQINRLRRNQAELQILPGQTPGGSIVALNNHPGDRYRVNLGVDNYGSQATGRQRSRLGLDVDNPLGFQEALSLAYVGSLDTNALLASAAVPYGYNTFSYTASYSEYQNLIGDTAILFGNTMAHNIGWNRVMTRSQTGKSALDLTLSVRKAEREINNIVLNPQRLTVARAGWNTLARFPVGGEQGNWTLDLGLSHGLKAFSASADVDGLARSDAHSQFSKVDFTATVSLPLAAAWSYRGVLNGQWSNVGLFGSEQIYAGGVGSVRGFTEGGISGDRGFVMRNEFQWTKAPQVEIAGKPLWLQPYFFLDAGRTELLSQRQWKQLSGAGAGLRAQWQAGKHQVFVDALIGAPLNQPAELGGKKAVAQASLNWTF